MKKLLLVLCLVSFAAFAEEPKDKELPPVHFEFDCGTLRGDVNFVVTAPNGEVKKFHSAMVCPQKEDKKAIGS